MQITLTQGYKMVRFVFNDDCTECDYVTLGFESGDEWQTVAHMVESNAHEGVDYPGWECSID